MPFLVILPFFGLVWLFSWKQLETARDRWAVVAGDFGLSFSRGKMMVPPAMVGTFADGRIEVDVETRGSGKNRTKWTRYSIFHTPIGPPVTLTKQGNFSFLRRFVGSVDHEVGDPFFDEKVVVDSDYPAEVAEFLTPARRAAVVHLFSRYRSATITDNSIVVSTLNIEKDPEVMRSTLRFLIDVAAVLSDAAAVDAMLAQQSAGDFRDAANALHELNERQSNAFTRQLEAEAWTELGDHQSAAPIFDELSTLLPENSDVANWSRVAHTPAPPPPPPPPAAPASPSAPAVAPSVEACSTDQQSVIDDLFDPARMSWQIVEHFEKTYQNQPVSWAGEVTTFSRYRHDSDFGEGPGIKATVLLGTVGRSDFVSSEVHAILELPALVELERGAMISFSGVLTTVDRFSRKLHVRSASLFEAGP